MCVARLMVWEEPVHAESVTSVWVTAEGMAPFLKGLSLDDVRGQARDDARRNAVERAVGVFVRGSTVMHNAQIADELVSSVARGVIEDEEWLDERIEEIAGKRPGPRLAVYRSKLKAKVRPVRVERRAGFEATASLNKQVFQEGEEALIRVRSTEDAYLHIFSVTTDGAVTLLLPNRFLTDNRIEADKELTMPTDRLRALGIRLRVMLPKDTRKAIEYIKVIASRKPVNLVSDQTPDGVFHTFEGKDGGMIKDVIRRLATLEDEDWTEVTLPYEIRQ